MQLPISAFKSEIVEAVRSNPVTIIVAETGAGKSTQVPQYLLERGYRVLVTEPRRLAARTLAQRVSEEMNHPFGSLVGFRTAFESADSPETRGLFCTDGLVLVRELLGRGKNYDVLFLDEVHQWNTNMELLVGWAKRELGKGAPFKLVIMSATIEAAALAEFYWGARVINVPGRLYPIVDWIPGRSIEQDVARLVHLGRSPLVFQPGKSEIACCISKLRELGLSGFAEIFPLHRELESAEQYRCFSLYGRPKIVVATNIAESSLTIPGIDAVVDSGLERKIEVFDGIERLTIGPIARANSLQRRGRGGREKDGIYVDHCRAKNRPMFQVPEIQRVLLDQAVLRLEIAGIKMEELELFHQPSSRAIKQARELLFELDCLERKELDRIEVTEIGHQVARLPLSAAVARMVVEGVRRNVAGDVVIVAAIIEVRSIVDRKRDEWKRFCFRETESDLLAQVAVYKALEGISLEDLPDIGVESSSLAHAREIVENLHLRLGKDEALTSTGKRVDILRSVAAGLRQKVYICLGDRTVIRGDDKRVIPFGSFFSPRRGDYLVGVPFDLQVAGKARGSKEVIKMVTLGSRIDPSWIDFDRDMCRLRSGKGRKRSDNREVDSSRLRNSRRGYRR